MRAPGRLAARHADHRFDPNQRIDEGPLRGRLFGAAYRDRTDDILITNQVLYQLS